MTGATNSREMDSNPLTRATNDFSLRGDAHARC
jgi:hypothetical protein